MDSEYGSNLHGEPNDEYVLPWTDEQIEAMPEPDRSFAKSMKGARVCSITKLFEEWDEKYGRDKEPPGQS